MTTLDLIQLMPMTKRATTVAIPFLAIILLLATHTRADSKQDPLSCNETTLNPPIAASTIAGIEETKRQLEPSVIDLSGDASARTGPKPIWHSPLNPFKIGGFLADFLIATPIWHIGFNPEKTIYENIEKKALENAALKKYLSADEIREIARQIAKTQTPHVAPLSQIRKITVSALKEYSKKVLEKVLAGYATSPIPPQVMDEATSRITGHYYECLDGAARDNDDSEIQICTDKFTRSSPYRLGSEVLSYQLDTALKPFAHTDAELLKRYPEIKQKVIRIYDQCMLARYFEEFDKKTDIPAETITKGCLLGSVATAANDLATTLSLLKVIKAYPNSNDREIALRHIERGRACFVSAGILARDVQKLKIDYPSLEKLDINKFKRDLTYCAGVIVIHAELSTNRSIRELTKSDATLGGYESALRRLTEIGIERGYKPCFSRYLNPERCRSDIETVITKEILRSQLHQKTLGMLKNLKSIKDPKTLSDRHSKIMEAVNRALDSCSQPALACAARAISITAEQLFPDILNDALSGEASPQAANQISGATMTELQTKVRECFDGKIKALKSIEAISTNIDRISAECTTATTQAVLPVIVRQTLEARLAQVITNPDDREQFIARLVATIPTRTKDITDQKKLREVLERDFYSEVLYEIMKHELEQNLGNFVPDPKRAEPIRTKLLEGLKERVGAAVGLDYKEGGNLHQNTMITELMRDAAILVAADGIELELKNYISNQKQVDDLSQYLITYFKSCMDKSLAPNTQTSKTDDIASTAKRATEAIEHCTLETKTESALNIMETELAKALKENLPGQSSAQKKIRDAILSQNADRLRQQTREALTETGSDTKLTTLKNSLQIQATSLITKTVLEQTLLGMNAAALAPQLEKDLDQCLSGIDQTKKELQPKINMCLNATRRSAVEQILKHQLQPKLSAYFPAESDQSRDILADVQTNLSQCLNAIALEIDPHEFGKKSEACIAPAIFIFTNAIGLAMLEKYSPLLPQDRIPKIEKVFKDCLARSKATPNMAWAQAALVAEQCGDLIKKAIVDGVGVSFVNFSGAELDEDGKKMMKSAFWSLRKILELMEAAPGAVPGATTPPKAPPNSPQDQPTLSEVLQYKAQLESLSALMAQAIKYSPATVRRDLVELGANIRALKKTATRDEITAILLKSSVLRTMIEAQIAAKIEHDVSVDQTTPAPIKKLVSESLSKAHIMRRIFSKGPGADAIDKLIDTIVKPMLDGKTVSMDSVPIEVSESVILALISDTENGGFVEQMLQAIVQEQIDQDIKKSILSWGRWKWIPAKIGRLMYNGNDLDWYSLRDTLAGKEAVAVFATHVLYETMLRPTKKLSDSERAAMRENLVTEANKTLAEAIKISGLANTKWAAATWPKLSQDFAKGMAVVAIDPNLPRLERKRILADRVRRFLNEVDSEIIRSRGQNPPAPDKHGVAEFDKAILQFIDGSLHKSLLEVPLSDNGLEEMKAKLKKLIKTAMKQN